MTLYLRDTTTQCRVSGNLDSQDFRQKGIYVPNTDLYEGAHRQMGVEHQISLEEHSTAAP